MQDNSSELEKDFLGYIPELPLVATNFIEMAREFNTSKKSYANLMLSDPTLSTRIFSYVNFVLNPGGAEYISVNKGVQIMGLHKFKNVVMAFALFPIFEDAKCVNLFKYSLLTGYYSKRIASQYNLINPHDAFLLGFLHDIGKIAMKNKFGERYKVLDFEDDINDDYSIEDEIAEFKYSHSEVSEYICRSWKLPIVISDAIRFHHYPLTAMLPQVSSIIFIADNLAHKNSKITKDTHDVFQYMQMSRNDIITSTNNCARKLLPFYEILGIN